MPPRHGHRDPRAGRAVDHRRVSQDGEPGRLGLVRRWEGDALPRLSSPCVLLSPAYYSGFILRFLVRDCGPVMSALVLLGVVAAVRRRWDASEGRPALQPLICWSGMGMAFYVVFAPKLIDHDYYELMLLPAAAAMWGALGFLQDRRT